MKTRQQKLLFLLGLLMTSSTQAEHQPLKVEAHRSPIGPGIQVSLSTKTEMTTLKGNELPLREDLHETNNQKNFLKNHMIRMVTKERACFYRVYKEPNVFGQNGTWLTNMRFRNTAEAMKALALLPEWYKTSGEPDRVALICLPRGTEVYIGNAAAQTGSVQKIFSEKEKASLAPSSKKEEKRKNNFSSAASSPKSEETRAFQSGGAVQLFVPLKNLMGKAQLTQKDVVDKFPLQKPSS